MSRELHPEDYPELAKLYNDDVRNCETCEEIHECTTDFIDATILQDLHDKLPILNENGSKFDPQEVWNAMRAYRKNKRTTE